MPGENILVGVLTWCFPVSFRGSEICIWGYFITGKCTKGWLLSLSVSAYLSRFCLSFSCCQLRLNSVPTVLYWMKMSEWMSSLIFSIKCLITHLSLRESIQHVKSGTRPFCFKTCHLKWSQSDWLFDGGHVQPKCLTLLFRQNVFSKITNYST